MFDCEIDTSTIGVCTDVQIRSWNSKKCELVLGEYDINRDVKSPGGNAVKRAWGKRLYTLIEDCFRDNFSAEQRARGYLVENARNYSYALLSTIGNPKLRAGSIAQIKRLGEKFDDMKFIITKAIHLINAHSGYRTYLDMTVAVGQCDTQPSEPPPKMVSVLREYDEFLKNRKEPEPPPEEPEPEFSNLKWTNTEGEEIKKAHVGDKVYLTADVVNLPEEQFVCYSIYEQDADDDHDFIKRYSERQIEKGKFKVEWTVTYTEDRDDYNSACEEKEKGYTLPEYFFNLRTKHNNKEYMSADSSKLEVREDAKMIIKDDRKNQIKIMKNDKSAQTDKSASSDREVLLNDLEFGEYIAGED